MSTLLLPLTTCVIATESTAARASVRDALSSRTSYPGRPSKGVLAGYPRLATLCGAELSSWCETHCGTARGRWAGVNTRPGIWRCAHAQGDTLAHIQQVPGRGQAFCGALSLKARGKFKSEEERGLVLTLRACLRTAAATDPSAAAALEANAPGRGVGLKELRERALAAPKACLLEELGARAQRLHTRDALASPALLHIGANLGWANKNDPFRRLAHNTSVPLRLALVEPQPKIHAQLRELTKAEPRVSVHGNGACATSGNVTFYSVATERLRMRTGREHWVLGQISSMSRAHVLKHSYLLGSTNLLLEDYIDQVVVPCLTVEQLLRAAAIDGPRELVALVVDAEGYDGIILQTLDFARLRPWLLVYEHVHLTALRAKRTVSRLRRNGYACLLRDEENTYCLDGDTATFARCGVSIYVKW